MSNVEAVCIKMDKTKRFVCEVGGPLRSFGGLPPTSLRSALSFLVCPFSAQSLTYIQIHSKKRSVMNIILKNFCIVALGILYRLPRVASSRFDSRDVHHPSPPRRRNLDVYCHLCLAMHRCLLCKGNSGAKVGILEPLYVVVFNT